MRHVISLRDPFLISVALVLLLGGGVQVMFGAGEGGLSHFLGGVALLTTGVLALLHFFLRKQGKHWAGRTGAAMAAGYFALSVVTSAVHFERAADVLRILLHAYLGYCCGSYAFLGSTPPARPDDQPTSA